LVMRTGFPERDQANLRLLVADRRPADDDQPATKALSPRIAVALSAVLNLVGAFLSLSVAATIASVIRTLGVVVDLVVLVAVATLIYLRAHTTNVNHRNVNSEWTGTVAPAAPASVAAAAA